MKQSLPKNFTRFFYTDSYDSKNIPKIRPTNAGVVNMGGESTSFNDGKLFSKGEGSSDFRLLLDIYEKSVLDSDEWDFLKSAHEVAPEKQYRIELEEDLFDTLTPLLFYFELSEILRYGLEKSYEQKQDDLVYLKGKLDFKRNVANHIKKKPYLVCRYWDLTTDTFPNQVLLKAANILMNKPYLSNEVKNKFAFLSNMIIQENVSLLQIIPDDFLTPRKIPRRYELAYDLAEGIIKRYYHSSSTPKKVECPSFMFNAAKIWESFLRVCIKKALSKEKWGVSKVEDQLTILEPSRMIIPDMTAIKNDGKQQYRLVFDVKYKIGEKASDLYQLCIYLGSYYYKNKPKLRGYLLYFDTDDNNRNKAYTFYPKGRDESPDENITIKMVPLKGVLHDCLRPDKTIDMDQFSNALIEKCLELETI